MVDSERTVLYPPLAELDEESYHGDKFIAFQSDEDQTTCSSGRTTSNQNHTYPLSGNSNLYGEYEYDIPENADQTTCSSGQTTSNQNHTYPLSANSNLYGEYEYDIPEDADQTTCSSGQTTSNQNHTCPLLGNSNLYGEYEYDIYQDPCISAQSPAQPEVNLKNVLCGIAAILTGRNKGLDTTVSEQDPSSTVEFLGPEVNGVSTLHPSVCVPITPPISEQDALNVSKHKEVLLAEPNEWLPDSHATACMQCNSPFTALTRGRHHCRYCGRIFCRTCTKGRCLLPAKFRMRDPQRVCGSCYDVLVPVQTMLKYNISNAAQKAIYDVMDWTCTRGWLNLPVGLLMEHEIYKAANTLRTYCQVARLNPEKSIPQAVLKGASGIAILTVAKAGALLTYKLGTGLVISRRSDRWSAPSAILLAGLGWGAQIGVELMDFIIVLHGCETVKAFSSRMHVSLGAGLSAAAGPVGRVFEANLHAGGRGSGMCYTYSCSKGAFVGVSLEGSIVATRMDANRRFYGDPNLTAADILLGMVEGPNAAKPLYSALDDLYSNLVISKDTFMVEGPNAAKPRYSVFDDLYTNLGC